MAADSATIKRLVNQFKDDVPYQVETDSATNITYIRYDDTTNEKILIKRVVTTTEGTKTRYTTTFAYDYWINRGIAGYIPFF